jgi:hypothetical protein
VPTYTVSPLTVAPPIKPKLARDACQRSWPVVRASARSVPAVFPAASVVALSQSTASPATVGGRWVAASRVAVQSARPEGSSVATSGVSETVRSVDPATTGSTGAIGLLPAILPADGPAPVAGSSKVIW